MWAPIFALLRGLLTRFSPWLITVGGNFLKSATKWGFALSIAGVLGFTKAGKEVLLWGFKQILVILDYILSLIVLPDTLKTLSLQGLFDSLPGQLLGLLGYIGIPEALAIISAALTVRLLRDLLRF